MSAWFQTSPCWLATPGTALPTSSYIDTCGSNEQIARAANYIDEKLHENFYYDYARRLGQLAPVRPLRVRDGARSYVDAAMRLGQRAGDIKLPVLERRDGWNKAFRV